MSDNIKADIPTRAEKAFTASLVHLMLSNEFEDIRTSEVVALSGYSRASFYSHYTDKYDLASKIIEQEIQAYIQFSVDYVKIVEMGSDYDGLLAIVTRYMTHVYENRDMYDEILDSRFPNTTLDEFCLTIMARMKGLVSASWESLDDNFDQSLCDYTEVYGSILHIKYWRLCQYSFPPEEMARRILALTTHQKYEYEIPNTGMAHTGHDFRLRP